MKAGFQNQGCSTSTAGSDHKQTMSKPGKISTKTLLYLLAYNREKSEEDLSTDLPETGK